MPRKLSKVMFETDRHVLSPQLPVVALNTTAALTLRIRVQVTL